MTVLRRRSFLEPMVAAFSARLVAFSPARSMGQAAGGNRSNDASAPAIQPVLNSADRYHFKRILPNGTTTFKVSSFDTRDRQPGGRSTYVNDAEKMRAYGMELTGPPIAVT